MKNKPQSIFQYIWWLPLAFFFFILGGFLVSVARTSKPPKPIQSEIVVATSPSIVQGAGVSLPASDTPGNNFQVVTSTPVAVSISLSPTSTLVSPPSISSDGELVALQQLALQLVNETRQAYGLNPVEWDSFAAEIGQQHVLEMSANRFLSHWNLQGLGPDMRHIFAGKMNVKMI